MLSRDPLAVPCCGSGMAAARHAAVSRVDPRDVMRMSRYARPHHPLPVTTSR
ncbi:hypothetical protein C7S14_5008 [Burkholderia cepacia]|nr:hypothetical protein C7S14_5008 [Burkholderia cepacia]